MNRRITTTLLNSLVILTTLLMQVFTVVGVAPAYAATLTVQSSGDGAATPANCPGVSCTLRDAIAAAASGDTITFDSSLSGATITLTNGELAIDKNLMIEGSALASQVIISGNNASRVFNVTGAYIVTLNSLTIANGNAAGGRGGGILNNGGALVVANSTLSGNVAGYDGGGIANSGASSTLAVSHSTFSNNSTTSYAGGGIYNSSGTATISNSTFSGNTANTLGGGIYADFNATTTVNNSTLSGNSAVFTGGGIYNTSGSTLNIANTIIANSSSGGDCVNNATIGANTNNLIEDGSCSASLSGDPLLSALGSYGGYGSFQTFALLPGSTAINAGDTATCEGLISNVDQRGIARVGTCDIGSFESQGFTMTKTGGDPQSATVSTAFTNPLEVTVSSSYSEPVDGGKVTFTPNGSTANASITGSPATIGAVTSGIASVDATANGTTGSYTVTASATGATSQDFDLTNLAAGHTVTFHGNGADGGWTDPHTQTSAVAANLDANGFTRTGYTFSGWDTVDVGGGTAYTNGQSYDFSADLDLYAQWTVNSYTVTYNGNGQTSGTAPTDANSPYDYNETVTVLGNTGSLVRTGYTFNGWNTAANGSGTSYAPGSTFTMGTANVTLYARWSGRTTILTTGTSWTVPPGVNSIVIECWGGGGGGGGATSYNSTGGGGGGGAYAKVFSYAVTPGQVIPYTIGAGGGSAGNGGNTTFNTNVCVAAGGKGGVNSGAGGAGGLASDSIGDTKASGGTGGKPASAGSAGVTSPLGSTSTTALAGNNGSGCTAGTAVANGSAGVTGNCANQTINGTSGNAPGGGGSGGSRGSGGIVTSGGAGGSGRIVITSLPAITTPTATNIGATTAILGANFVTANGGTPTARGICWGTSPAPTTNCASSGTATGVYTQLVSGLPANTLIYYRGYVTDQSGTIYSSDDTFTTDDITDGLILHWNFEEGAGTVTQDQTVNNLDGTLYGTGSSKWSTDVPAGIGSTRSIYLNGSASKDYVKSAASALFPSGSSPRTLCAWVKSTDGVVDGGADHIANYGKATTSNAFGLMIFSGNNWYFYGHSTADYNTGILANIGWRHHCVTYNGATVTYYLDGVAVGSAAKSLATTAKTSFLVGERPDMASDRYFDGWVDDVRLYSRELSAAEVEALTNLPAHTVTFNANGGSGSMPPQTAVFLLALSANTFTNTGYNFASWNTQPDGSGTSYANQQSYDFAADMDLHAQWTSCSAITVTNNADSGAGSLRQALADVCPSGGTITFDNSLSGQTITLASRLVVAKNVIIDGSTLASAVTISGNNAVQIMIVNSGVTATLDSLAFANARNTVTGCYSANVDGGAICSLGNLTVKNSAFSNNYAKMSGGAIFNYLGTLNVSNSSFSGNSVTIYYGGAIANYKGTVNVRNSTLSGNVAAKASYGGGILSNIGALNLYNTIIANSTGGDCRILSGGVSGKNSLIENSGSTACNLKNGINGNIIGVDPQLDTLGLQSNGGPTQTIKLMGGSSAVDAGDSATCAAAPVNNLDQRGVTRPQGAVCDIGAYEAELLTVTADNASKTFGDPDPAFTFTAAGSLATDPTCSVVPAHVNAGTYPISCMGGTPSDNRYTLFYVNGTLTINKADPVLQAASLTYNGAPQAAVVTATFGSSAVPGVASNLMYDGSATLPTNAGTYAVTADFVPTDTINFNSLTAAPAGSLVINPKAVDVYADPGQYKFVGDSDPAEFTYSVFPSLFGSDTLSGALSRTAGETIGAYPILNSALLSNPNYTVTYHGADFAVIRSMAGFAPADDAFLPIRRPTFVWDPAYFSGTPSGYTIEYSTDEDMAKPKSFTVDSPAFTPAADLPASTLYFWHVRAIYPNGTLSAWARTFSFTTGNPPSTPALVAPLDKVLVVQNATGDFAPLLDWGNSTLPAPVDSTIFEKYTVLVDDDSAFGSPIERDVNGITNSQYQMVAGDGLQPNTKYYWKVVAYNNVDGELHYAPSLVRTFTTSVTRPDPLLPVNTTAYLVSKRPTFSWTSEANALSYNIQLSLKPITTAAGIPTYKAVSSPFIPPADLAGNSTYYWRVQSNGANGSSAWSEVFTFKTGMPPTRPALVSPAHTALISADAPIKLDWSTVAVVAPSTFSYYEVQVSTSPLFTTTVVNNKSVTAIATSEITLPASTLNPDTRYYWRVKSVGSGGSSPWSYVRYFRTKLVSPTLLTPADAATGVSRLAELAFDWADVTPVTGVVRGYNLQVSTTPTFTAGTVPVNVWVSGAVNSSYTTGINLLPNKTYYWRVRATGTNTGGWTVFSFTTGS